MRFRTVKIWLSKGWYYAVYSVSLLLIPLITSCSSSRSTIKNKTITGENVADNNAVEGVNSDSLNIYSKLSIPSRSDYQDSVLFNGVMVALEDILKDGTAIYGPPLVEDKFKNLPLKIKEPEMRLMYGVQPPEISKDSIPLILLDGNIVEVDKDKLKKFDFEKDIKSRKKVAALLGLKTEEVKGYRKWDWSPSVALFGTKGRNGIFEVMSTEIYEYDLKAGQTGADMINSFQLYK